MRWLLRAGVAVAWVAAVWELGSITDDGTLQVVVALGFCIAAGLLVSEWWVLLLPIALGLFWFGYVAIAPCPGECIDPRPLDEWALLFLMWAAIADVALAAGVGLRRALATVARARRRTA